MVDHNGRIQFELTTINPCYLPHGPLAFRVLEYFNPEAQSPIPALTASCIQSQKSRAQLVNSRLVRVWLVGNLELVGHNENYWFTSNRLPPKSQLLYIS